MKHAKLADIAPAKPLKMSNISADTKVWHLNLDQIESNSGKVLTEIIAPVANSNSSTHWFDERHVLYSKLRPYLNKVVVPYKRGIATTELVPMMPDPKHLDRGYLAHYLKSNQFVAWVSNKVAGAKMPRVSMRVFWNHEIPLPPLPEQKRIASILDKADALCEKRRKVIAKLDELLQSMFLDMFGDPVTNPKGWDSFPLMKFVDPNRPITYGILKPGDYIDDGVPMLRIQDIRGQLINTDGIHKVSKKLSNQYSRTILKGGEIVISLVGTIGLVGKIPSFLAGANLHRNLGLIALNDDIDSVFLYHYMSLPHFLEILNHSVKGGIQKLLNLNDLKNVKILAPPLTLQNKFSEMASCIERQIKHSVENERKLNTLFTSLQQRAFRGDL